MTREDGGRWRKTLLFCLYPTCFLMGISSALHPEPRPEDFFGSMLLSLIFTLFCFVEAKLHDKPIPPLSGWMVMTTWPVSVPALLFRLHGVRGIGRVALFLLSLCAAYAAGAILIGALSH